MCEFLVVARPSLALSPVGMVAAAQGSLSMDRKSIVPMLVVACVAALLAVAGYPFLRGAQEPRDDAPRVPGQPVSFTQPDAKSLPASPKFDGSPKNANQSKDLPTKAGRYFTNENTVSFKLSAALGASHTLVVETDKRPATPIIPENGFAKVVGLSDGSNRIVFWIESKEEGKSAPTTPVFVEVQPYGPRVDVWPLNFAFAPGAKSLDILFSHPVTEATAIKANLEFKRTTTGTPLDHPFEISTKTTETGVIALSLNFTELPPGTYRLTIKSAILDVYGNNFGKDPTKASGDQTFDILVPVGHDLPLTAPGIKHNTGPYVPYSEFTKPRSKPPGFNPGDHVQTRVVRLYYFRDAHRVAQILNRDVKSYNRAAVDTRRRLAEVARTDAVNQSLKRKVFERDAVQAAQDTRVKEHQLKAAHDELDASHRELAQTMSEKAAEDARKKIEDARKKVDSARTALVAAQSVEVQKRESWQAGLDVEERMRADQFRLEVAAMHEDPDTYAPGFPNSDDPVQQVSISVIGESEIHLRGPISGVNIIREMVNQIDSPTGQVRVAIHTVQINGERQEKMERVAAEAQDYIDHSRFLTQQSALMLRKAVFRVASRKAAMIASTYPYDPQSIRDQRYLHEFFGRDFIEELRVLKSEFLETGNKLLSLHSMDTTSLASALFVIALSKNDTRQEILLEFKQLLATELPMIEQSFYEAGGSRGSGKCTAHNFGCFPKKHTFELMAQNARFQSFLGFFDGEAGFAPDVMTPMQREFIKLAQILKSRLVTELEFKQRVMERALVEERGSDDYLDDVKQMQKDEKAAKTRLAEALTRTREAQAEVTRIAGRIRAIFELLETDIEDILNDNDTAGVKFPLWFPEKMDYYHLRKAVNQGMPPEGRKAAAPIKVHLRFRQKPTAHTEASYTDQAEGPTLTFQGTAAPIALEWAQEVYGRLKYIEKQLDRFEWKELPEEEIRYHRAKAALNRFKAEIDKSSEKQVTFNVKNLTEIPRLQNHSLKDLHDVGAYYRGKLSLMVTHLSAQPAKIEAASSIWYTIKQVKQYLKGDERLEFSTLETTMDNGFDALGVAEANRRAATEKAESSRRPLDHRKMLDMLIDEIHDKYVELLEGTRSYTANIDDYIKRLATALDDDFNTQFYFPAFRRVRTVGTSWDVQLGQIETTSILTNNRTYGKVDPQATMEFDLPRRNILVTEAFQAGKALVDTYGALLQDPTFINLARMGAGMPTSTPALGQNAGVPSIRSVLPGISRATDEALLAQGGPGVKSMGTPLDALVPDPAIYKFETGTAYEIRPVIAPDGQSVNFHFNYMYTTNIREPVRADEKHLGRVKRHYIDTNVQLGNYELREISRYQVALRASRTAKGVPLLQDIPGLGVLFRPLPSAESSLQQNIILGQATVFPTLFDLMGLRWAPAVADLDPLALTNADFIVRQRKQFLTNRVFDFSSAKVDEALRIPEGERRGDLYRSQHTIPYEHPNGYKGPGMGLRDSHLKEGYDPKPLIPQTPYVPGTSRDGMLMPKSDMYRYQQEQLQRPPVMPSPMYVPGPMHMPPPHVAPNEPQHGAPPELKPGFAPPVPGKLPAPSGPQLNSPLGRVGTVEMREGNLSLPPVQHAVYPPASAPAPPPRRTLFPGLLGGR